MRTSIDIDDNILLQTKQLALQSKIPFTRLIEDALRSMLLKKNSPQKKTSRIVLTTSKGTGLHHGIDLNNSQSLLDIMDN